MLKYNVLIVSFIVQIRYEVIVCVFRNTIFFMANSSIY